MEDGIVMKGPLELRVPDPALREAVSELYHAALAISESKHEGALALSALLLFRIAALINGKAKRLTFSRRNQETLLSLVDKAWQKSKDWP